MTPEEIFNKLSAELGSEAVFDLDDGSGKVKDACFMVEPWSIAKVGRRMKTDPELAFDYLECLTGVDFPKEEQIQVVYHVYSYEKKHRMVLKVAVDRGDPVVPTLCGVWSAANWQERECYDLLGVLFDGHPDMRRILMPDDWEGHPLRKDYQEAESYHGIPTTRSSPLELLDELSKDAKAKDAKAKAGAAKAGAAKDGKAKAAKAKPPAAKKADDKADAKAETKADAKAETKADAKADAKAEAKADAKPEAKADAKAETKAEAKAETKAETKAGAKPEAKVAATAEQKAEAESEDKADGKAAAKPADGKDETP